MAFHPSRKFLGGALLLAALTACGASVAAAGVPPADAATSGTLSARVAGRTFTLPLTGEDRQAVSTAVLAEFARCNDVPRMLLDPTSLPAYRAEEHVELMLGTPTTVNLVPFGMPVTVLRLLVPLAGVRTQPDWFFYALSPTSPNWGVYRQQGAPASRISALRQQIQGLSP